MKAILTFVVAIFTVTTFAENFPPNKPLNIQNRPFASPYAYSAHITYMKNGQTYSASGQHNGEFMVSEAFSPGSNRTPYSPAYRMLTNVGTPSDMVLIHSRSGVSMILSAPQYNSICEANLSSLQIGQTAYGTMYCRGSYPGTFQLTVTLQ